MTPRRQFMKQAMAVSLLAAAPAVAAEKEEVPPTEDLMREHGILRRLLLVYREVLRRIEARARFAPALVTRSAEIVRAFIEDYHERDEEEYLFPRLRTAGKLTDLVGVLLTQHQAGRRLTADVLRLAPGRDPAALREPLSAFIRMYEPHAAREDTVLFPAFRALVGAKELDRLQDVFEDKEKALPGGGFEKMVAEVADIEKGLGIHDLALFTPHGTSRAIR